MHLHFFIMVKLCILKFLNDQKESDILRKSGKTFAIS